MIKGRCSLQQKMFQILIEVIDERLAVCRISPHKIVS